VVLFLFPTKIGQRSDDHIYVCVCVFVCILQNVIKKYPTFNKATKSNSVKEILLQNDRGVIHSPACVWALTHRHVSYWWATCWYSIRGASIERVIFTKRHGRTKCRQQLNVILELRTFRETFPVMILYT